MTTITDVMPIVESLPHADKFKLMQFLLSQLARDEGVSLSVQTSGKDDALWDIVGMAEGEDAEVARHHDKYLYGAE